MTFAPTPIPSRTQFVLEAIKHGILTGRLSPGRPLVEADLAAQFGVSKTPVREALKTLAGTGLVEMSQYKGVTVRTVDAAMARAVHDVRLLLEPEALRRTVVLGRDLAPAREALLRAEEAADRADRSLANRDFHRALYAGCGNPLLAGMLDELRDQSALVSTVAWATIPSWEREAREHQEILRVALEGDAGGAARLLHEHIEGFVRRAFPEAGGPGGARPGPAARPGHGDAPGPAAPAAPAPPPGLLGARTPRPGREEASA